MPAVAGKDLPCPLAKRCQEPKAAPSIYWASFHPCLQPGAANEADSSRSQGEAGTGYRSTACRRCCNTGKPSSANCTARGQCPAVSPGDLVLGPWLLLRVCSASNAGLYRQADSASVARMTCVAKRVTAKNASVRSHKLRTDARCRAGGTQHAIRSLLLVVQAFELFPQNSRCCVRRMQNPPPPSPAVKLLHKPGTISELVHRGAK